MLVYHVDVHTYTHRETLTALGPSFIKAGQGMVVQGDFEIC